MSDEESTNDGETNEGATAVGVRPVGLSDAAAIRDIYAPFVRETSVTFLTEVPSVEEMRESVERKLETDRYPWYVAERREAGDDGDGEDGDDGEDVVGYAYASRLRDGDAYQWVVETSVYVDPAVQRGGIGSALYDRLFETLRGQRYVAAYAALGTPNPGSEAFHRAVGFEHVGSFPDAGFKLGSWHDVEWYRKGLRESPADPDPPRPVSAVNPAFDSD